jgi:hypothetical protein
MANSPDSAAQNVIPMYELKWSHAEKTVARRAFDLALGKELEALLQEAKGRAARIEEPSELWDLESWLTERRREIDPKVRLPLLHPSTRVCPTTSRRPPNRRRFARAWTGETRPYSQSLGHLKDGS